MNAYAYYVVKHRTDLMLEQSARQQRVRALFPEPSLRARIASAAASLRRVFDPIDLRGPALPNLENYPYRG